MAIVQYFTDNHASLLYLIAGLSCIIELTILGMSGPLLFFAIACGLTAMLINLGMVSGWEQEVLMIALFTGLTFWLLWKPLKRFQNSGGGPDTSSDMIGRHVLCSGEISQSAGSIRYSGINWNARVDPQSPQQTIPKGAMCEISAVDGNVMIVRPLA